MENRLPVKSQMGKHGLGISGNAKPQLGKTGDNAELGLGVPRLLDLSNMVYRCIGTDRKHSKFVPGPQDICA